MSDNIVQGNVVAGYGYGIHVPRRAVPRWRRRVARLLYRLASWVGR